MAVDHALAGGARKIADGHRKTIAQGKDPAALRRQDGCSTRPSINIFLRGMPLQLERSLGRPGSPNGSARPSPRPAGARAR